MHDQSQLWQFGYLGDDQHENIIEGQKFSQNKQEVQIHLQCMPILAGLIQMRRSEEMGVKYTNRSQDMAVWVFGGQLMHKMQKDQNEDKTS